jgi:hypothetical protein
MARQLSSCEASFDFLVQLRIDTDAMPIQDPTVRWKELASPFRKVATIRIPAQDFTGKPRKDLRRHSPSRRGTRCRSTGHWAASTASAAVYETISTLRHEANDVPRREPMPDEEG